MDTVRGSARWNRGSMEYGGLVLMAFGFGGGVEREAGESGERERERDKRLHTPLHMHAAPPSTLRCSHTELTAWGGAWGVGVSRAR